MTRRWLLCGCLLLLSAGCLEDVDANGTYTIAVIGDSNSAALDWRTTWVQLVQDDHLLPELRVASGDAVVTVPVAWDNASLVGFSCVGELAGLSRGFTYATAAIYNHADAIVLALGTNDLQSDVAPAPPADVVACYRAVAAAAEKAGVSLFVATTPPVYPPWLNGTGGAEYWNAETAALNARVRAAFDPSRVIDFDSGFTADMYVDGRHLNAVGQQLRARRAARTIAASQWPSPSGTRGRSATPPTAGRLFP